MKALTNIGIYPTDNVEFQKTVQEVLNDVLQILLKHLKFEAVYCFGFEYSFQKRQNMIMIIERNYQDHQQWHINLLLIGKNIPVNSTANLADIIYQKCKGKISTILLCYSPGQIATSRNEHKHLFKKIIRSGWLVYGNPHKLAHLNLINLPDLDYKGIIFYIKNRLITAGSLLENVNLFFDRPFIAAFMLRNSVEQLCLGILYAFIHYHPNQFNIQYLVRLCKSCCGLTETIFPDSLFQQEGSKELLKTSASHLRFRRTDIFSKEEVQLFYQNCLIFKANAEPILRERLSQLNSQAHENKNQKK